MFGLGALRGLETAHLVLCRQLGFQLGLGLDRASLGATGRAGFSLAEQAHSRSTSPESRRRSRCRCGIDGPTLTVPAGLTAVRRPGVPYAGARRPDEPRPAAPPQTTRWP